MAFVVPAEELLAVSPGAFGTAEAIRKLGVILRATSDNPVLKLLATSRSHLCLDGRFLVNSVDANCCWSGFFLQTGRPIAAA